MIKSSNTGAWRSWLARMVWDHEVRGSSPLAPTNKLSCCIQNMKFYIASRLKNKQLVKEIHDKLERNGHEIISTWIREKNIMPYEMYEKAAKERAIQCIKEIGKCDIFILITDSEGAGMYTELGVAIQSINIKNTPKIYVIGNHLTRSMFFFYPNVKRFKTFDGVLEDINN